MFGYIRICKEELSQENFERFRAYYCGLCKSIGKYSNISRLGLNYEMTFLFILLSGLFDDNEKLLTTRCMLHPWKKEKRAAFDEISDYAAAMNILLAYRKLDDDWQDEHSKKAFFGKCISHSAMKKILRKYGKYDNKIKQLLDNLSKLEEENCTCIDEVADCFAKICEIIFAPDFIEDENTKKALKWMGYNVGRWIYLIDAFDDLEKDIKNSAYNPFTEKVKNLGIEKLQKELDITLTYTLSNIAASYDILDIKKNDEILKNIIYSGMYGMQNKILKLSEE